MRDGRSWLRAVGCGVALAWVGATGGAGQGVDTARLRVRLATDEADAVMAVLEKRAAGRTVEDADWARLFGSEGYRRLKERERSMGRPLEDSTFRAFVLSDSLLARAPELRRALEARRRADPAAAARRAFVYLPAGARIRATVYPVIKPSGNSFVFDVKRDPAIFLYLDPAVDRARFENTLAHELHHIGYGTVCDDAFADVPEPTRTALQWLGAFGEGLAMLAAAGGPDVHPHATSPVADRERWDRDVAHFDADLADVQAFLLDVLDGRLRAPEQIQEKAMSFFGVQGPWYTVGWKMAVVVERTFGRPRLVAASCDPRRFLAAYDAAAALHERRTGERLSRWSPELLRRIGAAPRAAGGR
ncbi:MAG TPA: DUF5700 domain-containing putative Zn-dependent protease [Longimicrobiales bacterium]|nr:DUF5700 domain-containing putative Zn-dependent protease [Longimicrobiales bacterium]